MNQPCIMNHSIIKLLLLLFFITQICKSLRRKTNKKYIAIIIERLKDGGTERMVSILANELSKIKILKLFYSLDLWKVKNFI